MKRQKDLEERIFNFILRVNRLVKSLPKNQENRWYGFQVMKSSSSIGANHAESTCALTKKDFTHDINKCRKEVKETLFWLRLISSANPALASKMPILLSNPKNLSKFFRHRLQLPVKINNPKLLLIT